MPVRKQDADRALTLLQQYHVKLTKPGDKALRGALEKVMDIFRSELFHALLDIQEYYELTLVEAFQNLNDPRILETSLKWQSVTEARQCNNNAIEKKYRYQDEEQLSQGELAKPPAEPLDSHYKKPAVNIPIVPSQAIRPFQNSASEIHTPIPQPTYEYEDIVLERGTAGLGFSIAGGRDNPLEPQDGSIYITKIIPGGAAAYDGRLKADDAIMAVNNIDTSNVCHADAVNALKLAGSTVVLRIRRIAVGIPNVLHSEPNIEDESLEEIDVQLVKGTKGLGFSIAGGVGNQHLPGDDGIFVTKIIEGGAAEADGLLQVGDKILSVDAVRVLNMSHETAVSILKSTANVVNLRILRQTNINSPEVFPLNRIQPSDLSTKEENVAPIILPPPSDEVQPDPFQQPPPTNAFENEIKVSPPTSYQTSNAMLSMDDNHDVELPPQMPIYQLTLDSHRRSVIPREPRVVSLNKTGCGLGFNIVGGDGSEGIYISYILAGGTADVSGELYRGDQLLSVNGIDLTKATHEEAAHALKSADKTVTMVAQYKPEDYNRFEEKIQELREQMMNFQ